MLEEKRLEIAIELTKMAVEGFTQASPVRRAPTVSRVFDAFLKQLNDGKVFTMNSLVDQPPSND
ncbi:MAG TPA: hypothetical protein DD435_01625 [Cyanobacteria bacterium UBA8530]|nr:hypothetical protein [Cyanobacteria bacterium UBA8530]